MTGGTVVLAGGSGLATTIVPVECAPLTYGSRGVHGPYVRTNSGYDGPVLKSTVQSYAPGSV